jgi:hypothetical protein
MGMPYSKQIHYAFDQVTPLVACGFRVLETSRDIAILMAFIQALMCLLLGSTLLAMLALLITVNPDLEPERRAIVTPTMKWLAAWVRQPEDRRWLEIVVLVVLAGLVLGAWAGSYTMRDSSSIVQEAGTVDEVVDEALGGTDSG